MRKPAIIIAIMILTACGSNRNNGKTAVEPVESNVKNNDSTMSNRMELVGAFGQQREMTHDEMDMFRKATAGDSLIVYTPLSVSTQVVAGTNYRFWCRFEDISDGIRRKSADDSDKYGYCWITIFKPLPGRGEPSVTSVNRSATSESVK